MSLNLKIKDLDLAHENLYSLYQQDKSISLITNAEEIQAYYNKQFEFAGILTIESEFVGNSFYNLDFINLALKNGDIDDHFQKQEKLFMKTHI